jgi:hypothetical protein
MDQALYQNAQSIFSILTILNPLVAEYWMRLGFAFAATGKEEEALMAFLDPLLSMQMLSFQDWKLLKFAT